MYILYQRMPKGSTVPTAANEGLKAKLEFGAIVNA